MLDNKYIITIAIIIFVMHQSGNLNLNLNINHLINDDIFKLIVIFTVAYIGTEDIPLAILITVLGAIIIQSTMNKNLFNDIFKKLNLNLNLNLDKIEENRKKRKRKRKVSFDESINEEYLLNTSNSKSKSESESDYEPIYTKMASLDSDNQLGLNISNDGSSSINLDSELDYGSFSDVDFALF
jgi:uncharacterized membrane protein